MNGTTNILASGGFHLFRFRSWPIAAKLSAALVLASLLPMLVVSYYNLQEGLASMATARAKDLEQLASATAGRIDQLVRDTRHSISYLAWSEESIRLVSGKVKENRALVENKMERLITANGDIELFMVLDAQGRVLASSKPEYVGRTLDFRDYFKHAIKGSDYISQLEIGTASNQPGVYFSSPVRTSSGLVGGVAVLKLKGEAIASAIKAVKYSENRAPFVIDEDGIIILHPEERALYHSLTPLPAELAKQLREERRFGARMTEIENFDLPELKQAMLGGKVGYSQFESPLGFGTEIVGYAPLAEIGWVAGVSEPISVYSRPLNKMFDNTLYAVGLMGFLSVVVALLFARTFTRPVRVLAESARAVEQGRYDAACVVAPGEDELGRLAQTFNAMIDGVKARERERDIFGRVVSPEVREKLLSGEIRLGGENRRVSVLFSDIRGFSTLSERMSPQDVVSLLNEYLSEMAEAIKPWNGYINNFIGDAIVVIFGAPESRTETEWAAVGAAIDMKRRLEKHNLQRREMGDPPIQTGIGISTGKVVAGQVGSLDRFLYTVIGDTVNVAARLESLTKEFAGNPILITAATYEGIKDHHELDVEDLGPHQVKGRDESVHVYAVRT
jgi:class 3 adenylate cyclase